MAGNQSRPAGRRCGSHMLCGEADPRLSGGKALKSPTCTGGKCLDQESATLEPRPGSSCPRSQIGSGLNGVVIAKIPHI